MTSLASLASVVMPCAGPLLSTVDKSQVRSHLSSPTACKSGLHTHTEKGPLQLSAEKTAMVRAVVPGLNKEMQV